MYGGAALLWVDMNGNVGGVRAITTATAAAAAATTTELTAAATAVTATKAGDDIFHL